uniref:Putative secreted protein n=1 Tax=Anopheles triannulatus TaxID=58253 RepID=A0A2M4B390_9DIPT
MAAAVATAAFVLVRVLAAGKSRFAAWPKSESGPRPRPRGPIMQARQARPRHATPRASAAFPRDVGRRTSVVGDAAPFVRRAFPTRGPEGWIVLCFERPTDRPTDRRTAYLTDASCNSVCGQQQQHRPRAALQCARVELHSQKSKRDSDETRSTASPVRL